MLTYMYNNICHYIKHKHIKKLGKNMFNRMFTFRIELFHFFDTVLFLSTFDI